MIKLEDGTQTYVDENLATAKAIWKRNNKEMAELFGVLEPTFANYVSGRLSAWRSSVGIGLACMRPVV